MVIALLFILYINILVSMCNQSVPGIFLNMNVPSVQVLLYADDIALVNDTVGRLQACLNVLKIFCRNYCLRVNESKTKVMVFTNGGIVRRDEQLFYNGRLECVPHYKYLGITFSSRLSWTPALNTLCTQSKRELIRLNQICRDCGDMPVALGLELFDKLVSPILLYGSEYRGCDYIIPH